MKKLVLAAGIAALFAAPIKADTLLGLYIGGQVWDNDASGVFGENGNQADFNLADEQQGSFYVALEHPLPLIPNIKIAKTNLDTDGKATLSESIEFGGEDFLSGQEVNSNFDVSYVDYTLYYELFDNGLFTFDFGITGRDFDSDIDVSTSVTDSNGDVSVVSGSLSSSEIVPMLYVSTIIGLPLTGFNVFAEGNLLSIDDHTLYDYQMGVSYELIDNIAVDLNLTAGYRAVKLELDDLDNLHSDLDFEGFFAGAVIHF